MTIADTARSQAYFLEEVSWGVTPADALKAARFTGESLGIKIATTQSKEIRADRQITDLIQTALDPEGGIKFEFSYGAFDDLLEGAMFSDWATAVSITATDIAANGTTSKFTSSTTNFMTSGVKAGQWLQVESAGNNGFFQVTAATANNITVAGEVAVVTAAAGGTVVLSGQMLRNGITDKSYSLEVLFDDVTQYKSFTGMKVKKLDLGLKVGDVLDGSFEFIGKNGAVSSSSIGTGAPLAAPENAVLNAINNIAYVSENGAAFTGNIKEFSLSGNNNLRAQKAVRNKGNIGIGKGRFELTGSFNAYFENATLYNKYLNGTETSLSFRLTDEDGNAYILTLPRIKFTDAKVEAGSPDSDVMLEMNYLALRHPVYGFTLQIDRFPAA